jgi:hypothetical protein
MVILDKLCAEAAHKIIDNVIAEIIKQNKVSRDAAMSTAKEADVFTTKVLGVLQEQGVYAAVLFILSRFGADLGKKDNDESDKKVKTERIVTRVLLINLLRLLGNSKLGGLEAAYPSENFNDDKKDWIQWVQTNQRNILRHFAEGVNGQNGIATNLQRLLAVKSLFEQTLIYVRYGAKAL